MVIVHWRRGTDFGNNFGEFKVFKDDFYRSTLKFLRNCGVEFLVIDLIDRHTIVMTRNFIW